MVWEDGLLPGGDGQGCRARRGGKRVGRGGGQKAEGCGGGVGAGGKVGRGKNNRLDEVGQ